MSTVDVTALFERYEGPVYTFACRILGNPEDARDLTQEVFLRAWQHRAELDPDRNLGGWLLTVARNLASHRLRRRRIVSFEPLDDTPTAWVTPADEPTPEQVTIRQEERALVHQVLAELAGDQSTALVLRHEHELTHQEIAGRLGVSTFTVQRLLERARQALLAILVREGAVEPRVVPSDADRERVERLVVALHALHGERGRLPGRAVVSRAAGLSKIRFGRLMRLLAQRGCIVGRGRRATGTLADATVDGTLARFGAA